MSTYEEVSLWIAGGALVVSILAIAVALWVSRVQRKEGRRLHELQEQVAAFELAAHQAAEEERSRPHITVDLVAYGRGHRIVIRNEGQADAHDVNLAWHPREGQASPFPGGVLDQELPRPLLRPGEEIPLLVGLHMQTRPPFDVEVTWAEITGERRRLERTIYD